MVLHRMKWPDERALYYEWDAQIGADNSLVFDGEPVFVIRPDELFGQIERVDYFSRISRPPGRIVGQMAEDEREFYSADVISTRRGLVVTAVTAVQRAFRRKRYVQLCKRRWAVFVDDVVAWINSKCRYFRNRKHNVFDEGMMPTWGYVPAPVVDESVPYRTFIIVPALGRRRRVRLPSPLPR